MESRNLTDICSKLDPLNQSIAKNPTLAGILTGESKGSVWYEPEICPTLAVSYSYCVGGCQVVGTILPGQEKSAREFFELVFQGLKEKGIHEFEFSTEDEILCNQIRKMFSDKLMESEMEYSYRIGHTVADTIELAQSYRIQKVDREFLNQVHRNEIADSEILMERLVQSWQSEESFLQKSESLVCLDQNKIVGIIFGSAQYQEFIVVDIEVQEQYRHQGIATKLTTNFINASISRGMVVQWDHVESNQGSRALAVNCGFELFKVRPYYWFNI